MPTTARTPASSAEALLAELRALIARHGAERFLAGPLVEPTPAFFPDAWSPDDAGVLSLARRVFVLAGVEEVRIELASVASPDERLESSTAAIRGDGVAQVHEPDGPAALQSVSKDWCVIGVDPSGRSRPAMLAASLCRVAARVFDAERAMATRDVSYRASATPLDDDDDTLRARDVATVYLGFDILTTNDTYTLFREPHGRIGARVVHRTSGHLSLEEMGGLLAAQLVARSLSSRELRRVLSLLGPNQAEVVEERVAAFDRDTLRSLLAP
jgi:hypothetical protein